MINGPDTPLVERIREARINELFENFMVQNQYRASQLQYIRLCRSVAIHRETVSIAEFEDLPFMRIGHWRLLFTPAQIAEIMWLVNLVAIPLKKAVIGPLPATAYAVLKRKDSEVIDVWPIGYYPFNQYQEVLLAET